MKVYSFNPDTGEYLGETVADESPLEPDVLLLPAHSTETEPPSAADHEKQVYRNGAWSLVPDWRGHVYWLADRSRHKIIDLEVEPPQGSLDAEPPLALADLIAYKSAALDLKCQAAIYAGFDCDALGAMHHYPALDKDQVNLAASVLDSVLPMNAGDPQYVTPFWCADTVDAWAWRNHTGAQIQQVGREAKAAVLNAQGHNAALQAQVAAAADQAALDAIEW